MCNLGLHATRKRLHVSNTVGMHGKIQKRKRNKTKQNKTHTNNYIYTQGHSQIGEAGITMGKYNGPRNDTCTLHLTKFQACDDFSIRVTALLEYLDLL